MLPVLLSLVLFLHGRVKDWSQRICASCGTLSGILVVLVVFKNLLDRIASQKQLLFLDGIFVFEINAVDMLVVKVIFCNLKS